MRDPWIGRATALLIGGLSGAYLPEQGRLWAFGVLVLLWIRLVMWRPRDFFSRVFHPEILLLAASLLLGFMQGGLADRTLPQPITLDQVGIVGHIRDWNIAEDKAVGIVRVEEGEGRETKDANGAPVNLGQELKGQTYRLTVYADKSGEISGEWKRVQPGDSPTGQKSASSLGFSGNRRTRGDLLRRFQPYPGFSSRTLQSDRCTARLCSFGL